MANARALLRRLRGVLFLFLLLLLALGVLWGYARWKGRSTKGAYIVYTAVFEVDERIADCFALGDRLIDARGKEEAGEILKITREEAHREDSKGVYAHPDLVLLSLTLGGEGARVGGEAKIGTLTPRVGEAIYLLGRARLEGLCVRVRAL